MTFLEKIQQKVDLMGMKLGIGLIAITLLSVTYIFHKRRKRLFIETETDLSTVYDTEDEESNWFADSIHEINFEEGVICKDSMLSIFREVREGMLEKLSEIKNYYIRKRRKCFKVDQNKYRETI